MGGGLAVLQCPRPRGNLIRAWSRYERVPTAACHTRRRSREALEAAAEVGEEEDPGNRNRSEFR